MGEVLVIGSTNVDVSVRVPRIPGPGETLLGTTIVRSAGGKGANQALAASRAGARTRFVGAVGADDAAALALAYLKNDGVDLTGVKEVPDAPTGTALISVDDSGENSIIVVPGANATVDAAFVRQVSGDTAATGEIGGTTSAADVLVLQGEIPRSGIEAAAKAYPGRVMLNLAPVIEVDTAVIRRADPLVVNEHEANLVLALFTGAANSEGGRTETETVLALLQQGVKSVVLTLGSHGALVADSGVGAGSSSESSSAQSGAVAANTAALANSVQHIESTKVSAVDTTGAGDAFVGALAAKLAEGTSLAEAASYANRFAAASVQGHGTQSSYPERGTI